MGRGDSHSSVPVTDPGTLCPEHGEQGSLREGTDGCHALGTTVPVPVPLLVGVRNSGPHLLHSLGQWCTCAHGCVGGTGQDVHRGLQSESDRDEESCVCQRLSLEGTTSPGRAHRQRVHRHPNRVRRRCRLCVKVAKDCCGGDDPLGWEPCGATERTELQGAQSGVLWSRQLEADPTFLHAQGGPRSQGQHVALPSHFKIVRSAQGGGSSGPPGVQATAVAVAAACWCLVPTQDVLAVSPMGNSPRGSQDGVPESRLPPLLH